MRSTMHLLLPLTLLASLSTVSGCAGRDGGVQTFPPPADLIVEAKPAAGAEIVTDAQAAARYDAAVEAWGERGWAAVARVCRWAERRGMEINCP